MASDNLHEDLWRHTEEKKAGERAVGITFGIVFLLIGLGRLHATSRWEWAWFAAAATVLLLAFFWVGPLRPINALWHRLGLLLAKVVNHLMGSVFFLAIYPAGALMRLSGKDPLRLKLDRNAKSYWQARESSESVPQSMADQF